MVYDRCNYFSIWAIYHPFTPLTAGKFQKNEKSLEISSFYASEPK